MNLATRFTRRWSRVRQPTFMRFHSTIPKNEDRLFDILTELKQQGASNQALTQQLIMSFTDSREDTKALLQDTKLIVQKLVDSKEETKVLLQDSKMELKTLNESIKEIKSLSQHQQSWFKSLVLAAFPVISASALAIILALIGLWYMSNLEEIHSKEIEKRSEILFGKELVDEGERSLCHIKSQEVLRNALKRDKLCLIVQGARGSGKSWTVEYVVRQWYKEDITTRRVLIFKSKTFNSDQSVIEALEAAIGYQTQQAELFFQDWRIARSVRSIDERFENTIRLIETLASKFDVVFVIDDLEDLSVTPLVSKLLLQITNWGENKILRPVVVSSSFDSAEKFQNICKIHESRTFNISDLSEEEANNYLIKKLGDKVQPGDIALIKTFFRLQVAMLRQLCNIAQDSSIQEAVDALRITIINHTVSKLTMFKKDIGKLNPAEQLERRNAFIWALKQACGAKNARSTPNIIYIEEAQNFLRDLNFITKDCEPFSPIHKEGIEKYLETNS